MNVKRSLRDIISDTLYSRRNLNKSRMVERGNCRILMYHSIEKRDPKEDRMGLAVSPDAFFIHMKYLKENGFYIIDLLDFAMRVKKNSLIPAKSAVITFDDGYKSVLTDALPILEKFNFKATLFVNIYFLEKKISQKHYWHRWQALSWLDLRELHERGLSIGSHAVTHQPLREMSKKDMTYEIINSKEMIEKNINDKICTFSFPHGSYNRKIMRVLKDNSFFCACTSRNGLNDNNSDILALKRTEITAFDNDLHKFEKKMFGSNDWLGVIKK